MATRYNIPSDSDNSDHEEDSSALTLFERRQMLAYSGEPELDDVISNSPRSSVSEGEIRGDVGTWCTCNNCTNMDKHRERLCCNELQECAEKFDDSIINYNGVNPYNCITEHPGFVANCLNWEVLDVAWLAYKQQYGCEAYESENLHKRRRHVAYRQLARFLFGVVGRLNRYILPSCAVKTIREQFPSPHVDNYVGFNYADE